MHIDDFIKNMVVLENAYSNFKITEDETRMEFWYSEFRNVEAEVFQEAIQYIYRTERYAPTISVIYSKVMEIYQEGMETASQAWSKVPKLIISKGGIDSWEKVKNEIQRNKSYSSYFIQTIEEVGWKTLKNTTSYELQFYRKHFEEVYNRISSKKNIKKLQTGELQKERLQLQAKPKPRLESPTKPQREDKGNKQPIDLVELAKGLGVEI